VEIVKGKISIERLRKIAQSGFGEFVKAVVDIERKIMVIDAELHADEEAFLIESGSRQQDLWGVNLYPEIDDPENRVEFNSMINIRPHAGNRSRGVENPQIRAKIIETLKGLIDDELST
jgi:hypothetical protein